MQTSAIGSYNKIMKAESKDVKVRLVDRPVACQTFIDTPLRLPVQLIFKFSLTLTRS